MTGNIIFDPHLGWPWLSALAMLGGCLLAFAWWRGLPGAWLRALGALALLGALANPALQTEQRSPLNDIVFVLTDASASQTLSDRGAQVAAAEAAIGAELGAMPNLQVRRLTVGDGDEDAGTLLMGALGTALAEEPRARIAGAILLTDGQVHDAALAPDFPAPLHVLLTGRGDDWDRRLVIETAPAFGILGEPMALRLRIEDQGAVPATEPGSVDLSISHDGEPARVVNVPVGQPLELPVTLDHAGVNVISFALPAAPGELTDRNNSAVVQINGVRDRLRVLLVSGEPHAGERTWRNLLKADAAVDLVHFTILRPPEKQDGVPVEELSLIAFPTRELFVDKIEEFDLIIFDRYSRRGILPASYMENIAGYVRNGGAVLVAAGPEFATADSIFYSALGDILPGAPTARVIDGGFRPGISDRGARHPVTEGLEAFAQGQPGTQGGVPVIAAPAQVPAPAPEQSQAPDEAADAAATGDPRPGKTIVPDWGRWFRIVDIDAVRGETVMTGPDDRPLLILDRVGEGRVALLASDHAWLWSRGFEGGGPQQELLRRLAHWMMKEPQLEEEALTVTAAGQVLSITRRTMGEGPVSVTVTGPGTGPDATPVVVPLTETAPGRFTADWDGPEQGLYRLTEGDLAAVIVLGPAAPREFEQTIATEALVAPVVLATRGGMLRLEDGIPDVRRVREGRAAAGRGWIGITPRDAFATTDLRITPLLPAWLMLILGAGLMLAAWLREGRGRALGRVRVGSRG